MCQSLLDSEKHLHAIVSQREFTTIGSAAQKGERHKLRGFISNETFLPLLEKSLAILKPIDALIVKYQSDSVPTSEVIPDFYNLQKWFREMKTMQVLSKYLCFLVTTRRLFLHGKGHGLAYLLDPRLLGDELPYDNRDNLEMMLSLTPATTENLRGGHATTRQGEEGVQEDSYDEVDAMQRSLFVEYTRFVIKCTED